LVEVRSEPHPRGNGARESSFTPFRISASKVHHSFFPQKTDQALGNCEFDPTGAAFDEKVVARAERFEEALRWLLKEYPADQA
jgi:hypothetical protein